jgi:hypothetical protein
MQEWRNCDVGSGLYLEGGITNNLASGRAKSGGRELAARHRAHVCFRHENERLISGSSNESDMATNYAPISRYPQNDSPKYGEMCSLRAFQLCTLMVATKISEDGRAGWKHRPAVNSGSCVCDSSASRHATSIFMQPGVPLRSLRPGERLGMVLRG